MICRILPSLLLLHPASAGFTFTEVAPSLTSILSLRGGKEHDAEDAQFRDEAKRKDAGLDGSLANLKSLLDTLGERIKEKNQPAKLADDAPSAERADPLLADPVVGDRVRVRPDVSTPRYEWGDVSHRSVGTLVWFEGDRCVVDFPRHPHWNGVLSEIERVAAGSSLPRKGDRVRVRRSVSTPAYGWGRAVSHESVGTLQEVVLDSDTSRHDEEACIVAFPRHANWTGLLSEMELADDRDLALDDATPAGGDRLAGLSPRSASPAAAEPAGSAAPSSLLRGGPPRPHGATGRLGYALGSTFASVAGGRAARGLPPRTAPRDGNVAAADAKTPPPLRALPAALRNAAMRLPLALLPLFAFTALLGALLSLVGAVLDRTVGSLVDAALATLGALAAGGVPGAAAPALPPVPKALILVPLRLPGMLVATALLTQLCIKPTVPATLDAVRRGFEDGFRQRSRARTNASPRAQHQEEMLRKISSWWLGMIRVVQAARAAAFAIGLLVLIDAAAVAQPAAQGPPAVG